MWFKQIQLFQLIDSVRYPLEQLISQVEQLLFTPCFPSMPFSMGWVPLVDEEGSPIVRSINDCIMLCLQIEEKILPATVIRQQLHEKIKKIETQERRKLGQKEKLALKDEIIFTLLPRAFSKFTRVYGYIDTKNHWLVLGTNHTKKTEQFLSMFKKAVSDKVHPFNLQKLSPTITHWLKHQSYPTTFSIEKSCVLQDANHQKRIIRCQQQDLFANSIQSFIKDGCEVKQLALSWQDRINFVLADDFSLRSLKFHDDIIGQAKDMEAETKQQQFDANFFIMSETFSTVLTDLLSLFLKPAKSEEIKTDSL